VEEEGEERVGQRPELEVTEARVELSLPCSATVPAARVELPRARSRWMTGGSASWQAGADLAIGAEAGADLAAVAPVAALFPTSGLAREAVGGLAGSLVRHSSASWATSPRKSAFVAGLEVDRRGSSPRAGEPTAGAGCVRGMAYCWSALLLEVLFSSLSPCCIEAVCRCRSSELLESV
jgi:hypothetical protein